MARALGSRAGDTRTVAAIDEDVLTTAGDAVLACGDGALAGVMRSASRARARLMRADLALMVDEARTS